MRIQKSAVYLSFHFLFFSCITADQSERKFLAQKATNELSTRLILQKKIGPTKNKKVDISVEVLDPEADWTDALLSNFIIQDDKSVLLRLSSQYYLVFVRVKNRTGFREVLTLNDLEFEHEGDPFRPVAWDKYPSEISCLNWKGNLKNLYNAGVATVTTVFIVGALAVCAKEGKCEGVRHIDTAFNLASSGETVFDKTLSNPVFTTRMEFWNEKDPWVIGAGADKEFFLLYPKSWSQGIGTRALMSANCF